MKHSTICGIPVPAILNLGPAPLKGLLGPNSKLFSKIAIFCWFWAKIGGSLTREWLVKMNFSYKIRWSVKLILALEPKFHGDWCKNGHATRKTPKIPKISVGCRQNILFFSLSGLFIVF